MKRHIIKIHCSPGQGRTYCGLLIKIPFAGREELFESLKRPLCKTCQRLTGNRYA